MIAHYILMYFYIKAQYIGIKDAKSIQGYLSKKSH